MSQLLRTAPAFALVLLFLLVPATAAAQTGPTQLPGTPGTDDSRSDDAQAPPITVTDVRVARHTGFDRVVFEIGGDGQAGWLIGYDDDPRSDGSGDPVDVAGNAALRVAITNVAMPDDAPAGVTSWEGDLDGPAGGAVTEVIDDQIFEGLHVFFVGVDRERPFVVARLSDPQRIVIDIVTATTTTPVLADADVPVGGVATGRTTGGEDRSVPFVMLTAVLALGFLLATRTRRQERDGGGRP